MIKINVQFFGGRGGGGGKGSSGGGKRTMDDKVLSLLKDQPGWGKTSRIQELNVLKTYSDGSADLRVRFNTTPDKGTPYSEDKRVTLKRVKV